MIITENLLIVRAQKKNI